jgi:hypothetical protein
MSKEKKFVGIFLNGIGLYTVITSQAYSSKLFDLKPMMKIVYTFFCSYAIYITV